MSLVDRMVRAAKLDVALYEEVEADETATGQAMTVVLISSLCAGIGSLGTGDATMVIVGLAAALIGWFVWAFLTWLIGTKLLPTPQTSADLGQLLRTIGFSAAPGVLRIVGFIPVLGAVVAFLASVWMLVAMVIAVRQALDYDSTGRAVAVCLIGWVVQLVVIGIPMALLGAAAMRGAGGMEGAGG
jgi:hypothetical protein